ncbi:MAG: signal peptide peptidase SppA [Leptospiraceae bacterium]|nr:signal peptide peptidase SppA [Leptospiraceae bacterium]
MERNKVVLFLILILTILATVIGLVNITVNSAPFRQSRTLQGKNKIVKDAEGGAYLLKIEGEIHSGKSTYSSTGLDTILAKLEDIESRADIKGILLEINSPGGTVGASQEIYSEIMRLKKKKKVVVSMKDLAASGGYYIAAASDHIFALPGTITGSIGVITISPNISGLLKKYDIKMNVFKKGKYKDTLSMFKNPTEAEEEIIEDMLEDTYSRFIEDVKIGRNMTDKEVEKAAEGRVFSGEEAVRKKLVDSIGGRREALQKLSELCGHSGTMELIEDEDSPFDRFFELLSAKTFVQAILGKTNITSIHSPIMLILPSSIKVIE